MLDNRKREPAGAYLYPNKAECHVHLGQIEEAKATIEKADRALKGSEDKYAVAYLWMIKGMVEGLEGNVEKAVEWLTKAEKRMTSLKVSYDTGLVAFEFGCTLIQCGRKSEGVYKLKRALELFKEDGSKGMIKKTTLLIRKHSH